MGEVLTLLKAKPMYHFLEVFELLYFYSIWLHKKKQKNLLIDSFKMQNKKILIVSNFFYPEIKPRAFRATELAKGFCAKGYMVDIILPNKEIYRNNVLKIDNLNFIYSREKLITNKISTEVNNSNWSDKLKLKRILKTIVFYFFPSEIYFSYNHNMTRQIINSNKSYDKIISISHPLSIHLSVVLGKWFNENLRKAITIAEFSDPMFKGNYKSVFPLNILFGYFFSWNFEFFVVPISNATSKFTPFKVKNKIKVIPQGLKVNGIRLADYQKNDVTTFCYAGSFYKKLRNPSYFFEFLKNFDKPFIFELYLSRNDPFREYVANLSFRNGEVLIHDFILRDQLLFKLSKKDFLINFENDSTTMSPSKLIDYTISKRPILSFNKHTFDDNEFIDFVNGDYSSRVVINIHEFDINKIIEDFDKI